MWECSRSRSCKYAINAPSVDWTFPSLLWWPIPRSLWTHSPVHEMRIRFCFCAMFKGAKSEQRSVLSLLLVILVSWVLWLDADLIYLSSLLYFFFHREQPLMLAKTCGWTDDAGEDFRLNRSLMLAKIWRLATENGKDLRLSHCRWRELEA